MLKIINLVVHDEILGGTTDGTPRETSEKLHSQTAKGTRANAR